MSVSLDYLRNVLHLPESTTIVRIETENPTFIGLPDTAHMVIEDPSFAPVAPGCHLLTTDPNFKASRSIEFVGWSHEQGKGATNV
jgi:hypothetical protein